MPEITVATANLNNLFSRYNFAAQIAAMPSESRDITANYIFVDDADGDPVMRLRSFAGRLIQPKPERDQQRLAERLLAVDADVLAVQEAENRPALAEFATVFLRGRWPHICLLEGNDDRFIDVGMLSKLPLGPVTSHRHAVHPDDPDRLVFSRDLLAVDVLAPDRSAVLLRVFVTHLKSNYIPWYVRGDARERLRLANQARRARQADTIAAIVARSDPALPWLVVGDFNAAPDDTSLTAWTSSALQPVDLLAHATETRPPPPSRNPEDVPDGPRWTHRWSQTNAPDRYELLDHIWGPAGLPCRDPLIHRRDTWTASGSDHDPASIIVTV